jgi:hypothetical protein
VPLYSTRLYEPFPTCMGYNASGDSQSVQLGFMVNIPQKTSKMWNYFFIGSLGLSGNLFVGNYQSAVCSLCVQIDVVGRHLGLQQPIVL